MAPMQGFLGPLSVDFDIIFLICGAFIYIRAKSSGVHVSSAFTTAAWRDDVIVSLRSMSEGASPVYRAVEYISESSATHLLW